MSSHIGSPLPRALLNVRFVLAALVAALLGLSCSTVPQPRLGSRRRFGIPSHLQQSCGAACAAPVGPSTGEILAPAATRTGQIVLETSVQVAKTLQGLITLERILTGAELDRVEAILVQCVTQAHVDVNESFQKQEGGYKFKNGKFPSDEECKKVLGVDDEMKDVSVARELGRLKHAAAFACVKDRLSKEFSDNFTVEPRYKPDPDVNGVVLTEKGPNTLHPDLVVHATRNATDIQCVYELKFPCLSNHKLDPLSALGVKEQLRRYQKLTKRCPVAVVSPKGLDPLKE